MALVRPTASVNFPGNAQRAKLLQFANRLLKICRTKADVLLTGAEDFTISMAELTQLNFLLDLVCQDKHDDCSLLALPNIANDAILDAATGLHDFVQQFNAIKLVPPVPMSSAPVAIGKHFASLMTIKLLGISPMEIDFSTFPRSVRCLQLTKGMAVAECFERMSQLSSSLRFLTLNHCELNRISFPLLQNLHCLEICDLSFNKLSTLSCLVSSHGYTTFCSDNGFLGCPVSVLNVSHNNLRDVLGLEMLTNLVKLDLSYNCLTVDSAGWPELRELDRLNQLDVFDNPIAMCGNYRVFVISLLPLPQNVLSTLRRPSPNDGKVQLPSMLAMETVTGVCLDGRLASYGELKASRQTFSWKLPERRGGSKSGSGFSTPRVEKMPAHTKQSSTGSLASSTFSPVRNQPSIVNGTVENTNDRHSLSVATPIGTSPLMSQSLLLTANIVEHKVNNDRVDLDTTPQGTIHSPAEVYSTPAAPLPALNATPIPKESPPPTAIAEPFLVTRVPADGMPLLLSVVSADENIASSCFAGLLVSSVDFKLELVETALNGTILRRLAAPSASAVNCDSENVVQFWTIVLATTLTSVHTPSSSMTGNLSSSIASSSITAGPGSRTFVSLQFDSSSEASRFLELLSGGNSNNSDLGFLKSQVLAAFR